MKKCLFMITILVVLSLIGSPSLSEAKSKVVTDIDNPSVNVEKATKYYMSLEGERIEYKEDNLDLIIKKKKEDLKKYNKVTGKNLKMDDLGNNKPVTVSKEPYNLVNSTYNRSYISGNLPIQEVVRDGDLVLVQQVFYEGKVGENLRYNYHSYVAWNDAPLNQKVDGFASAWDEKAVAVDNTFSSSWLAEKSIVGGFISDSGKIQPDSEAFHAYGHGVKKEVEYGDFFSIIMDREVAVNEDYVGHRADIVTKYHHTYGTITGIGINIGPAAITFSGSWGDTVMVEYGFVYGDK